MLFTYDLTGTICLSILDENKDWIPSISVKQVLIGIQLLLTESNISDPVSKDAYKVLSKTI